MSIIGGSTPAEQERYESAFNSASENAHYCLQNSGDDFAEFFSDVAIDGYYGEPKGAIESMIDREKPWKRLEAVKFMNALRAIYKDYMAGEAQTPEESAIGSALNKFAVEHCNDVAERKTEGV